MRLTKLDRVLSADGELQPVLAKTRDLRALTGIVHGFLSADLAGKTRVANLRDGRLVLIADHSAAAAKLQLLAPALVRLLQDQRRQVNSVSVRVQPNASRAPLPNVQKSVYFSTPTLDRLRELHGRMSPSAAREALGRLLQRHSGTRKG